MTAPPMRHRGWRIVGAVLLGGCLISPTAAQPPLSHDDLDAMNAAADAVHPNGKTALMLAAKQGRLQRVKALLAAKADVNRTNNNGGTPLMYAALGGNTEIVELFLDRGADVNAAAKNGWSALMVASAKGHTKVVELLLAAGADPNSGDVYRWTPMMRAVYENRPDIVELFLRQGRIDVNRTGENEMTALHLAVSQGYTRIARMLVESGARVDARDAAGRTPLDIAIQKDHPQAAQVLRPRP